MKKTKTQLLKELQSIKSYTKKGRKHPYLDEDVVKAQLSELEKEEKTVSE